jgi:carboxyl-terminal processing protease
MRPVRSRERIVWTVVTVVLLAGLAVFALSPRLLAGSAEDETQAYLGAISQVYRQIRDTYVTAAKAQPRALYEGAMKGMLDALGDPNSLFMTAGDLTRLTDITRGSFGGVGLTIVKVEKVGAQVQSSLAGTPGYRAGITAGDLIVKVDGESMAELTLDAIRDKLRGEPGTNVTVTIKRGDAVQFDTTVTRAIIEFPAVQSAMMKDGIGYLRISDFTPQAAERSREAIKTFIAAGYTGLILDLRYNGGGLLSAGIDVANLFFDKGVLVQTKNERVSRKNVTYNARADARIVDPKIPIAVLVNRYTASASEIVSGALRDYHRATLFGEKTYGKGSVQEFYPLEDDGYKLTIALYYLPSGVTIDAKGIEPDRVVTEPELSDAEQKSLNDLLNTTQLKDFVKANSKPSEGDITAFIAGLHAKGIALNDRYLRKLIRNQQNITNNNPPLVDLEFDIVLEAAVKAMENHELRPTT